MNPLQEKHFKAVFENAECNEEGCTIDIDATSIACFEITKEFSVGYTEWLRINYIPYIFDLEGNWLSQKTGNKVKTSELPDLYIEHLISKQNEIST